MSDLTKLFKKTELLDEDISDRKKMVRQIFDSCEDDDDWTELMNAVVQHLEDVHESCGEGGYADAAKLIHQAIARVEKY